MAADLGVRGYPQMAIYLIDQRVAVSAPVRGPAPHAYQRVAARCGRQRLLEPLLLHPEEAVRRGRQTGTQDDSILLDSPLPRELEWVRCWEILTQGGHRDGHLFEFNYTDFLETLPGLGDEVPCQTRHPGRPST